VDLRFSFTASCVKYGLNTARIIKPSSGDFIVRFWERGLTFFSADKRRFIISNVESSSQSIDPGWISDEYNIPIVKTSLFDPNLDSVSFTLMDNSISIQAMEGDQRRKAIIKKRTDPTKRRIIPDVKLGDLSFIDSKKFSKLLRIVGCSALVRETKTEEEMRVNQVHFDSMKKSAFSSTRHYASYAVLDGICFDFSIIGSDIPQIRAFCSKIDGDVGFYQDKNKLYIVDTKTKSIFAISKLSSIKPDFSPPSDEFKTEVLVSKDKLVKNLTWALSALDGTQRLTCEINDDNMTMLNGGNEVFSFPIIKKTGNDFKSDLPAKFFHTIINHIDSDTVILRLNHSVMSTIIGITEESSLDVSVVHYVQAMRSR
jgi:hypothetical protein